MRLPLEGPECRSSGWVRKVGNSLVYFAGGTPTSASSFLRSLAPSPEFWVLAGRSAAMMQEGPGPGRAALPVLQPAHLRISGLLGLGGGLEACQQEDSKKIVSNLGTFSCLAEMSCSLLPRLPSPRVVPSRPCRRQVR